MKFDARDNSKSPVVRSIIRELVNSFDSSERRREEGSSNLLAYLLEQTENDQLAKTHQVGRNNSNSSFGKTFANLENALGQDQASANGPDEPNLIFVSFL